MTSEEPWTLKKLVSLVFKKSSAINFALLISYHLPKLIILLGSYCPCYYFMDIKLLRDLNHWNNEVIASNSYSSFTFTFNFLHLRISSFLKLSLSCFLLLLALKTQYSLWHLPFMKVKYIIMWGLLVQQADSSLPSFISL